MVKLGKYAQDKVTGFKGTITAYCKHLYGCDTYLLQPDLDKDGKMAKSHWLDEGRIEILGEKIQHEKTDLGYKFELGQKARDKITGFEGIITACCVEMFGCDTYIVQPEVGENGAIGESVWLDEGRIEITGAGVKPAEVQAEKNGAGDMPETAQTDIFGKNFM